MEQTYAMAQDPEGKELLVGKSRLLGREVSRFVKLYESVGNLLAKAKRLPGIREPEAQ